LAIKARGVYLKDGTRMNRTRLGKYQIDIVSQSMLTSYEGEFRHVITVNAELIVLASKDVLLGQIASRSWNCVDGQIPYWFARFRGLKCQKISGSAVFPALVSANLEKGRRVLLLGGTSKGNAGAVGIMREGGRFKEDQLMGYCPPFSPFPFPDDVEGAIHDVIVRFRPHLICVAFGSPKAEKWIDVNRHFLADCGVEVAIGVGGSFELFVGVERRAPAWVSECGLEGVWRLIQDPSRVRRFMRVLGVLRVI